MKYKMKKDILVFTQWYLPGYKAGGPIRSVANIVESLKKQFNFDIITTNVDYGNNDSYKNIVTNKWISKNNIRIFYFDKKNISIYAIYKLIKNKKYNKIYLNSLFSPYFTILPILLTKLFFRNTKIILAPRGMLGKGALEIKSRKKKLYIFITRFFGIYRKIYWQASSTNEQAEIIDQFGKNTRIKIVQNISILNTKPIEKPDKTNSATRFFFLSRISKKKNLLFAIELLNKIDKKVIFDIIGPIEENEYWNECKTLIKNINTNVKINYLGAIPFYEIQKTISNYHFMLLPTMHENYGHVIIEALASGCPVIISKQTPWQKLEQLKIGWDISLQNSNEFIKVLNYAIDMNTEEYKIWSENAIKFVSQKLMSKAIIKQNYELFELL